MAGEAVAPSSSPSGGTTRPASLAHNPCKWGDAAASACAGLGEEEEAEERGGTGAGGGSRDPSSSHQQQSDERYPWLTKIRDGEGRYTGRLGKDGRDLRALCDGIMLLTL